MKKLKDFEEYDFSRIETEKLEYAIHQHCTSDVVCHGIPHQHCPFNKGGGCGYKCARVAKKHDYFKRELDIRINSQPRQKTPSTKRVYLDVDGVLNSFTTRFLDYMMKHNDVTLSDDLSQYNLYTWFTDDSAKEVIQEAFNDILFWAHMTINPEMKATIKELVDYCSENSIELYMCSSLKNTPTKCLDTKRRWIRFFYPELENAPLFFLESKHLLAQEGSVLVDDYYKNADDFSANGGVSLIFDAHYNREVENHVRVRNGHEIVEYLKNN